MALKPRKEKSWKNGDLYLLDQIPHGDPTLASALETYAKSVNGEREGRNWSRGLTWVENILFGLGRHYVNEILANRISSDSSGNLYLTESLRRRIPQPVNDLLGRYIETNISILTENRPVPRITPASDSLSDQQEAKLSELNIEYLWEELDLPEQHRELVRLLLYTGIAFLEVCYDPLALRHSLVQDEEEEPNTLLGSGISVPVPRRVPKVNPDGSISYAADVSYGDIVTELVSGFEMYLPDDHAWNRGDLRSGWIMKESYVPIEYLKQKYLNPAVANIVTKKNGYFRDNIEAIQPNSSENHMLWWWERLPEITEGSTDISHIGSPNDHPDYTQLRIFDRKPNRDWPNGRTIITAGSKVIYDSPKAVGARAYDKRWPHRWHPYIRYRWEGIPGSMYGRALVTKMLPYIKRIDSIDATMIMYRRTIPIASWIVPKGSSPVEGMGTGEPGSYITFDPNRTARMKPEPIYPAPYPQGILNEREMALRHLEEIAGTEQILHGQRPSGTTSGSMLQILRNLALSAKSPILQAFDESMQMTASALNQETKKWIKEDERFRRRISILAREKASPFTIEKFSGSAISDNVNVKIDTVSQALFAKEAKAQRAIEVLQYGPNLASVPVQLQTELLKDMGWPDVLAPQGGDISRAKMLIQFSKDGRFDLAIPMPEDDPYVLHDLLVKETKSEGVFNLSNETLNHLYMLIDHYRQQIERIETARLQQMMMMQGGGNGQA